MDEIELLYKTVIPIVIFVAPILIVFYAKGIYKGLNSPVKESLINEYKDL